VDGVDVGVGVVVMLNGVGAIPSNAFANTMVPFAGAVIGITFVLLIES